MRRYVYIFIIALIIAISACTEKKDEVTPESTLAERNVRVAPVERRDMTIGITTTGRIEADQYVNISPVLGGKIEKIHIKEGDTVTENQLLVELNDAQLVQAEQSFRNIEKNYQRMQELLRTDAIDQKSFEEIETAYIIAQTNYEQVFDNTIIKAPISGRVANIMIQEGETYNSMMLPYLIRLLSYNKMKAMVNISDLYYPMIRQNMKAEISVNAYPDKVFNGIVNFISPEADRMSGSFSCEIQILNGNEELRHNQFARVFIITQVSPKTLIIPQTALIDDNTVYAADGGFALKRTVTTGLSTPEEIEVLSGLNENELVIIVGNIGLSDNYPINIID